MRLGTGVRLVVFLRSFAIQGSWNYRTLLGTGFAFALLPALRVIYRNEPQLLAEALERHSRLFNSHPYLAPVALGAVATLEAEREDPAVVERFKTAVRGSLGTLGDRLVWAGWRPVCVLAALALLFAGAPWWVAVFGFLIIYNSGHVLLRAWALRLGLREGIGVGERLRHSPLGPAQRWLDLLGAFLVGLVLPLAAAGKVVGTVLPLPWIALAGLAAVAGLRYGSAIRTPMIALLALLGIVGLALKMLP
ncbi:MAG: PTS system mannose/fructose/sorbose family transporter subunit IID [Gemmatimonadetes bacterium]|nr:PTS system mannose/fructose/sorbose family transporter subunit IID [Gemmatimonadota bacterium]